MGNKYKVKITSHGEIGIDKLENIITKYRKPKPQSIIASFKEIASDLKGKKGNKKGKTVKKAPTDKKNKEGKKKGKRMYSHLRGRASSVPMNVLKMNYLMRGGKKSKYNKRRMRKFRRTRRKRGGNCETVQEICASQYDLNRQTLSNAEKKKKQELYDMCIDFDIKTPMIVNLQKKCKESKKKPQTEEASQKQVKDAQKEFKKQQEEEKKVIAYNNCKNDCESKCKAAGGKKSRYNIKMARKFRRTRRKRGKIGGTKEDDLWYAKREVKHYITEIQNKVDTIREELKKTGYSYENLLDWDELNDNFDDIKEVKIDDKDLEKWNRINDNVIQPSYKPWKHPSDYPFWLKHEQNAKKANDLKWYNENNYFKDKNIDDYSKKTVKEALDYIKGKGAKEMEAALEKFKKLRGDIQDGGSRRKKRRKSRRRKKRTRRRRRKKR